MINNTPSKSLKQEKFTFHLSFNEQGSKVALIRWYL